MAITLKKVVRVGQVLHLALPLPRRLRRYDIVEQSYRIYALVRRRHGSPARVGLLFLGKRPPHGEDSLPKDIYLLSDEETRDHAVAKDGTILVRLEPQDAPGGVAREERVLAENADGRIVEVRASLPVAKGARLSVTEIDGEFETRAAVTSISIDDDGQPRLRLLLDEPLPEHMRPSPTVSE